jgi:hypothetical protein
VVVDVGKTAGRQATIGASISGVIGMIAIVSAIAGASDNGGAAIAVGIVGALFLLPVVLVLAMGKQIFRPRRLVFEPAGVRWDDPQGAPWAIAWHELAAISVSKHTRMRVPMSANDAIARAATEKMLGEQARVRLDMFPADAAFGQRHPEMAPLWERQDVSGGYRLPLGSKADLVPVLDQALRTFAPAVYRGVVNTEGVIGLT